MPTIKEVARAAGVSTTTVSHVINSTRFVGDELRERVRAAMTELDYRPNSLARSLRLGQTKTIGLIIPDNANPFFADVARSIEDAGFANGYSVILGNSDGSIEKQRRYIEVLVAKQVDGIIFISAGDSALDLQKLAAAGVPTVIVDRDEPDSAADVVMVDNEWGGYIATMHLAGLGHRRIACIAGPSQLTPSAQRVNGYRRALAESGLGVQASYVTPGDFRVEGGIGAATKLLALPEPPTAIFVCNDMMAIGAIKAARDCGLDVPSSLSIVGFDDISLAQSLSPALTTVAQPIAKLGQIAADLLIERTQKPRTDHSPRRVVLRPELVIRASTAAWDKSNERLP